MTGDPLEAVSRREFGRLVALLARRLGPSRLELAEDAVQDAFVAAVRSWPSAGIPDDPGAWLYRVAWNRAVDRLRRVEPGVLTEAAAATSSAPAGPEDDAELRLVLLCCHPALPAESQVALTLKVAAGFSVAEIARLLGAGAEAVEQRLTRAKRTLRGLSPEALVSEGGAPVPVAAAMAALYAMFSEGYASHTAESGLRLELCFEALRLLDALLRSVPAPCPEGHALAALFAFQASRLEVRRDGRGEFQSLRTQDRSRWDRRLIALGTRELGLAIGPRVSRFHLEAEIASIHAAAPRYQDTDWTRIVALYELLGRIHPTPAVQLNRAIALGERDGPEALLAALADADPALAANPLLHAARADAADRLGRPIEAAAHLRRGLAVAMAPGVRRTLADRLEALAGGDVGLAGAPPS